MTTVLNKYKVLLTAGKFNVMYPEQEQIIALNTVIDKLKYDNLKVFKYIDTYPKNQKVKGNQAHPENGNVK